MASKPFCRLIILLVFALSLAPMETQASAAGVPRLWRVSYPGDSHGTVIYILGISHIGTELEYDDYLQTAVVPAFMAADVLHFEDGGGQFANTQMECENPLTDPAGIATLKQARDQVERGNVEFFRRIAPLAPHPELNSQESVIRQNAAVATRALSEPSIVDSLQFLFRYLTAQQQIAAVEKLPVSYQPIVTHLRTLRPTSRLHRWMNPTTWHAPIAPQGKSARRSFPLS